MPTYGYECTACAHHFEVFQSIKDDPLTTCEQCGGTLRKRIYPVGIAFKGSGFYVNDYTRKSEGGKSEGSNGDTPGGDSKTTDGKSSEASPAKAEPKNEAKAETKTEATPAAS